MTSEYLPLLCVCLATIAFLYSSVGHAGASGYIAVFTLFGFSPGIIKPVALILNILVASLASWQFRRAGHFPWRLFWPFALLAAIGLPLLAFDLPAGIVLVLVVLILFVFYAMAGNLSTTAQCNNCKGVNCNET